MKQVTWILAVAEEKTLRDAASELSITQPAATKMLHELSSALGLAFFDRVGRGIRSIPQANALPLTSAARLEAGMLEVVIGCLVSLPASDYSFRVIDNATVRAACCGYCLTGYVASWKPMAA